MPNKGIWARPSKLSKYDSFQCLRLSLESEYWNGLVMDGIRESGHTVQILCIPRHQICRGSHTEHMINNRLRYWQFSLKSGKGFLEAIDFRTPQK